MWRRGILFDANGICAQKISPSSSLSQCTNDLNRKSRGCRSFCRKRTTSTLIGGRYSCFSFVLLIDTQPNDSPEIQEIRRLANIGKIPNHTYYGAILDFYGVHDEADRQQSIEFMEEIAGKIYLSHLVPQTLKVHLVLIIINYHFIKVTIRLSFYLLSALINQFLKERYDVKIGVVTNSAHPTTDKLEWLKKAGLDIEWDAFVNSCEVLAALFFLFYSNFFLLMESIY